VAAPEKVLAFWFEDALRKPEKLAARMDWWFGGGAELDPATHDKYEGLVEQAALGELDGWRESARGILALVILLDQLPRVRHRGSPAAFAHDAAALALAREAIAKGLDRELHPVERAFLYMPFQHVEDRDAQAEGLRAYERNVSEAPPAWRDKARGFLDYARRHAAVVERFGRFPHRNAVLDRAPTPEEERYLTEGGETFGATTAGPSGTERPDRRG